MNLPVDILSDKYIYAFLITLMAGLSTGFGSLFVLWKQKTNPLMLAVGLGFSAGAMLYISFVELFVDSRNSLVELYGNGPGSLYALLSLFGGMVLMGVVDRLVPEEQNPHESRGPDDLSPGALEANIHRVGRMGLLSAVAIAIHNFPEGIASFMATIHDSVVGSSIAIAIAIHNIPEGIAVAVPIYYATADRGKAFRWSFLSGLAEPVGALLAWLILFPFINETVLALVFGLVAGIMTFLSLDELLPTAERFGKHHAATYGVVFGMAVMAFSIHLL